MRSASPLLWLRLGTWCDSVFDGLRPKSQRQLFRTRQGLRESGLAAGDIRVEARAHAVTGDNQMDPPDFGADDAADDDDRDPPDDGSDTQTPLEPVQIVYRTLAATGTAVVFR